MNRSIKKAAFIVLSALSLSACVAPTEVRIDCLPTQGSWQDECKIGEVVADCEARPRHSKRTCSVHVVHYGTLTDFEVGRLKTIVEESQ